MLHGGVCHRTSTPHKSGNKMKKTGIRRKCTTVLHGGVCHRTSTPHKSGNKMKKTRYSEEVYDRATWRRMSSYIDPT